AQFLSLEMSVGQLLLEAFRRTDELERFKTELPAEEVWLEKTDEPTEPGTFDQTVVNLVLRKLEKPRSLRDIKREMKTSEFAVVSGVAELLEKGVLRRTTKPPRPPAPVG